MKKHIFEMHQSAIKIFQAGLGAVEPGKAIRNFCRYDSQIFTVAGQNYNLNLFKKIIVIGAGKAGASMAKEIEAILGDRITTGIIVVKYGHIEKLKKIKIHEAGHPVPDHNGYTGAKSIYQLASSADKETLVICLISGGGSALMPLPVDGISLEDKQETTKILLSCGATINEINSVRKHLSAIKGGGLARAVYPATLISLILSDVVGNDLDVISSGPCVPDSSTFVDCKTIFNKYSIQNRVPSSVLKYIDSGILGTVPETSKAGQNIFAKTQNIIIGCNFNALLSAKDKAEELGYNTLLLSSTLEGETRDVAAFHMAVARDIELHNHPVSKPACLLSGGETTVTIKGEGKGGRNQEFVLAALIVMAKIEKIVIFSAGTDGTDGPTDAAGAIADNYTQHQAKLAGIDPIKYLENNDSYNFFQKTDGLYKTGPTNTNVMDIRIILIN